MSGLRQTVLGIFMAFLFSALVLGSISLSLLEGGYSLAEAPTALYTPIEFNGQEIVNMASPESSLGAGSEIPGDRVIYTPTSQGCAYPAGWIAVTIRPDDTLRSLAIVYSSTEDALKAGNCMVAGSILPAGAILYVPANPTQLPPTQPPVKPSPTTCHPPYGWVPYRVRQGDTMFGLAVSVGMTSRSLQLANCLPSADLRSGQILQLPFVPAVSYPTATRGWPTPVWLPSATTVWPPIWTAAPTQQPSDTPAPPIQEPPTQAPPTQAPPTQEPPTQAPPTQAPPTQAPPTQAPPTQAPPTQAPPTQAPPTQAPPTQAPPTQAPPTQAPPTQAPPTQAPPTQAPPTQAPPTQAPPTQAPPTEPVASPVPPPDEPLATQAPVQTEALPAAFFFHSPFLLASAIPW